MEVTIDTIMQYGVPVVVCFVIIYFLLKYLPQVIEYKIKQMKNKDYMLETYKSALDNNSQVIQNNTEVIKTNTQVLEKILGSDTNASGTKTKK